MTTAYTTHSTPPLFIIKLPHYFRSSPLAGTGEFLARDSPQNNGDNDVTTYDKRQWRRSAIVYPVSEAEAEASIVVPRKRFLFFVSYILSDLEYAYFFLLDQWQTKKQ